MHVYLTCSLSRVSGEIIRFTEKTPEVVFPTNKIVPPIQMCESTS